MAYEFIEADRDGRVLTITMTDPSTRNAISDEMAGEINQELDRLEGDADLRALVVTGRDPSFCSGANVKRMARADRERAEEPPIAAGQDPWDLLEQRWSDSRDGSADRASGVRFVPVRLHNLRKPSIAAVNGYAMGLGLGIALSCDIRIASESASMSETFIRRGLIPADGSCWQLPRIIGLGNAMMMQYTGDIVDADEALRIGLVNRVVPHGELMDATMEFAVRLADGATYSMALIKRLVHTSLKVDFEESMRLAGSAQAIASRTEDHGEGVRAWVEKRKPAFKGR